MFSWGLGRVRLERKGTPRRHLVYKEGWGCRGTDVWVPKWIVPKEESFERNKDHSLNLEGSRMAVLFL